jgi:hypothetical protein
MAFRNYRIESVQGGSTGERADRVRCTLTRLEDGRVINVAMRCTKKAGDVVSLDDAQVYFAMWLP